MRFGEHWRDIGRPDLDVETVLGLSVGQLEHDAPELAIRWRQLGVFPTGFDARAAAAVWEIEVSEAIRDLRRLVRRSLITQHADKESRLRLHDLLRELTNFPETSASCTKFNYSSYYADFLKNLEKTFLHGGNDALDALKLFDLDSINISTGHSWSVRCKKESEKALNLVIKYAVNGSNIVNLRMHPYEILKQNSIAIDACDKLSDFHSKSKILTNISASHHRVGNFHIALQANLEALNASYKTGDIYLIASDHGNIGLNYRRMINNGQLNDDGQAVKNFFIQHCLAVENNYADLIADSYGYLGNHFRSLNLFYLSMYFYIWEFNVRAYSLNDDLGAAKATGSIGIALKDLAEDYVLALKMLKDSAKLCYDLQ